MKLFILRHGRSPSAIDAGVSRDFDRPLSKQGREDVRKTAAHLGRLSGRPTLILASPFIRAQQTAQEVREVLKPAPELRTYEPLSNKMIGMDLYRHIVEDDAGQEETLVVGHQPQLGELATYLTGAFFDLKPGGIIAVQTDDHGKARVLWSANPADIPS
ncbi:MAG: phosphohistidine phosphatase SixA [Elusimicrobiota bacterium]